MTNEWNEYLAYTGKSVYTLATYYLANRQPDSEWVVLPVTNMEAYLGSTSLSRQYLPMIPKELMERKTTALGVSVYRMSL